MAESSTNGKGKDDSEDARGSAIPTRESVPAVVGARADELDVFTRGSTVGRYLVLERLGAGAMGVVYAAYDPELDRKVAIKILRPSEGKGDPKKRQARLVREAKAMAKLSHANVGSIFDVGVHDGQVFMALEYLPGGTLRDWLAAEKRPWREIVRTFIEVGNGLAAAHVEGLIHRDFKPDNVLLDKAGKPKVVDFGLVRLSTTLEMSTTGSNEDVDQEMEIAETQIPMSPRIGEAALTKTGALAGTPAYMAPEQFLSKTVDERTDQFAFCVALYEALYGERPFAGETVIAIADTVTDGKVREAPKSTDVPIWLRRVILHGLAVRPDQRWATMDAVIAALGDDPAIRRRRRLMVAGAIAVVLAGVLSVRQVLVQRRQEVERQIARHLQTAKEGLDRARAKRAETVALRSQALAAFDSVEREKGEALWLQMRTQLPTLDGEYEKSAQSIQTALLLDHARSDTRARLADTRFEHLLALREFRMDGRAADLLRGLTDADGDGRKRQELSAPGVLAVTTSPPVSDAELERYERDPASGRRYTKKVPLPQGLAPELSLPPGSYRLSLGGSALARVVFPFEIERGQRTVARITLPDADRIPRGFVHIPEGSFYFGDTDEGVRTSFSNTVPAHRRRTRDFIIQKNEVTFGEWIEFLKASGSPKELLPYVDNSVGRVALSKRSDGKWQIELRFSGPSLRAVWDQPVVFAGRQQRSHQDWRRLPVTGISPTDVERYAFWLGGVVGRPLRVCTELEWERAARGADDRVYPHGDTLAAADANIDGSYGRLPLAFGLDEIGQHRVSDSPFGLSDMAGNAFEIVTNVLNDGLFVGRGGAYYYDYKTATVANRQVIEPTFRFPSFGFRLCGDG